MCGISGVGSPTARVSGDWIAKMNLTLKHRGPDDEGYLAIDSTRKKAVPFYGEDSCLDGPRIETNKQFANFYLGHRRLSIIDPTPKGHQPMCSSDGNAWIVFNGEIYNYIELREELKTYGYNFSTGSDTEVLIAAYKEWGERCLNRLDGMWAFVLYDKERNQLFGARDRTGVKPLYYYHNETFFAFASEIKALLSLPFYDVAPDYEKIFDYLAFKGFDFAEGSCFKDIIQLQPSHAFIYNLNDGQLRQWKYYTLDFHNKWKVFNEDICNQYIEEIKSLLFNAVRLRLRSDVPVGSALSGGIDSSSLVCIISNLMKEGSDFNTGINGNQQKVFSACFPGTDVDESSWAEITAKRAGAKLYYTTPTPNDFFEDIEDIGYYQDTPYGSPSVYAQYRVMKLAKENGVTVLLDGQGADELFTGYTMYYDVFFYQMLMNLDLRGFTREMKSLENSPVDKRYINTALFKQLRRMAIPDVLLNKFRNFPRFYHRYINPDFWNNFKERTYLVKDRDFKSLNNMLYEFFTRQKLGNLLRYEDRNSMRFSIESRTPFADYLHLMEYVFKVPAAYKIHNGWSKYLLREAMKGIIPDQIRLRRDKKGFTLPHYQWLSLLGKDLSTLFTSDLKDILNIPCILADLEKGMDNANPQTIDAMWSAIIFSVWKKVFRI